MNPYIVVEEFERRLAEWCGSKYAVAVESGSAAMFLSLMYRKFMRQEIGKVVIPKLTYPSAACSIIHAGGKIEFKDVDWVGEYELYPLGIWDAALRLKKGMYHGGFQCLSFHIKKHLPIGRGGMILLDDKHAYEWLKLARFDGREPIPLQEQKEFTVIGWNMYMSVEQGARGIELFEMMRRKYPEGLEDLSVSDQQYADLSKHNIYQECNK
jgi:dTDP-4-amino-4,6-dideoxygalactose transaminase